MKKNNLVEEKKKELIEEFVRCLDEDILPWEKGWKMVLHTNLKTGKQYKGINQLLLMFESMMKGYTSTEWATFNQLKDNKNYSFKGAKSSKIIYFTWFDKKEKKNISLMEMNLLISEGRKKEEFSPIYRLYDVFNLSQVEGYEKKNNKINDVTMLDEFIEKTDLQIIFSGNQPAYNILNHQIFIPPREQFYNDDEFYSTLFHEVAHSTIKNLERKKPSDLKKEEEYAFEELVAEISSVFLCCAFEKELKSIQNNKAYIQGWASRIKNNGDYLLKAISNAEKITDYILGF